MQAGWSWKGAVQSCNRALSWFEARGTRRQGGAVKPRNLLPLVALLLAGCSDAPQYVIVPASEQVPPLRFESATGKTWLLQRNDANGWHWTKVREGVKDPSLDTATPTGKRRPVPHGVAEFPSD